MLAPPVIDVRIPNIRSIGVVGPINPCHLPTLRTTVRIGTWRWSLWVDCWYITGRIDLTVLDTTRATRCWSKTLLSIARRTDRSSLTKIPTRELRLTNRTLQNLVLSSSSTTNNSSTLNHSSILYYRSRNSLTKKGSRVN